MGMPCTYFGHNQGAGFDQYQIELPETAAVVARNKGQTLIGQVFLCSVLCTATALSRALPVHLAC